MEHLRPADHVASAPVDSQQPGCSSYPTSVPGQCTYVIREKVAEQTGHDAVDEIEVVITPRDAQPRPSALELLDEPGFSRAIGPYCTQAGITQDHFTQDDTVNLPVQASLKKGLVLELNGYLTKNLKYTRRQIVDVLAMLAGSADGQHFDGLDDNLSAPTLERRKWKFNLSPEEQGMIWVYKGRHNNSLKGHINIFAKKVSEVNPYCVLVFKFNRVKKFGSRKRRAPFFHGKAVCKFDGCTEYDFVIKKAQVAGKDLKVKVRITGDIIHGRDFQLLRLVIGDSHRNNKSKKAKLSLKQLVAESSSHVEKQNGFPSPSSSANQATFNTWDNIKELLKVRDKTEEMGSIGYVQGLSMIPIVGIIVFTDAQLKILIEKIKDELVTLHLGETVLQVKDSSNQTFRMQYWALVVSGHGNDPPLPLAEYISHTHSYPEFMNFLMRFEYAVQQLDERYSVPHRVIVDCRWDAITAVIKSFNVFGTEGYLQKVWDGSLPACKVYICSAHLMHVVSRHLADTETNLKTFILQCVSQMINTSSKDDVDTIFGLMCKVLLSKVPPKAETLQQLESETPFEYDPERDVYKESVFPEESDDCSWLKTSPYYRHYKAIQITNEGKWGRSTDKNPYYAPAFVRYFLKTFMAIAPLWTGIIDAAPPTTNAPVTDWFRTFEREIEHDEKRLRLGQIIQTMADSLHGRIREYQLASLSNALRRPNYDGETDHAGREQGNHLNSLEQDSPPQAKTRTTTARRNKAKRLKKE
ncbi:uncharacterized protein LOC117296187 [Asterias rubens]|uniref:uncharacterized protein LOC117296187 n=1 Tax=Asterias rubens TaxID=7604 RepID=UPI001454EC6C|nr:uncharacterized protein LOC117296187 [Asterias rubens]